MRARPAGPTCAGNTRGRCHTRTHTSLGDCTAALASVEGLSLFAAVSPASPCAWNVCIPGKAPLTASDSSSSGSSGEHKQQKAIGAVEAVNVGPGWETSLLPRTEAAAVGRCAGAWQARPGPLSAHGWFPGCGPLAHP